MTPQTIASAREFFHKTFCDAESPDYRNLELLSRGHEVVRGTVFHFRVSHPDYGRCSARIYFGFGNEFGGRLWLQEAQSLVRFTATPHSALPRVRDGFFSDEHGVGVVLTESRGDVFTRDHAEAMRSDPAFAFRWFSLIVDAVRALHGHGLMHRDIWRESFQWEEHADTAPVVTLFGFEMSAFIASLLEAPLHKDDADESAALQPYLERGGRERRLFRAPEVRVADNDFTKAELTYRSDIFSVGVCAYEWFIGDLPPELGKDSGDPADVSRVLDARIAEAHAVPAALRTLLRQMIRIDPRTRPTAAEAVNMLVRLQDDIVAAWSTDKVEQPYLIAVAPGYVNEHVQIQEWQNLSTDEDIRFAELRTIVEKDLRGALLVHEPGGAVGYVQGGKRDEQKVSVWVLVGKQAVYFCEEFYTFRLGRRIGIDWALHVKYIVDRRSDRLRNIATFPLQRRIRAVEVVHSRKSPEVHPEDGKGRHPPWKALLEGVRVEKRDPDWMPPFRKGFEWWLQVQAADLQIHQYAYRRVDEGRELRKARLVWDIPRDRKWIERDPMRDLLASRLERPTFGAFFDTLVERSLGERVTWIQDEGGRPAWRDRSERNRSARAKWLNNNEIELFDLEGDPPPQAGWLCPSDDRFSEQLLRRQTSASASLFEKRHLLQALYNPTSIRGPRNIWGKPDDQPDCTGTQRPKLKGRAPEIVKDMLSHLPFYALQGPPGTGKTTVVADAVAKYLCAKPGARILISAQSHYALDELAERLMPFIEKAGITAVRVGSEQTQGQIRDEIKKKYLDVRQAEQRVAAIEKGTIEQPAQREEDAAPLSPALRAIAAEWTKTAQLSIYEIQDRIWRGSNLVFATCGACTDDLLGIHDEFDAFDWVIVEEAAKAWPVELAMPLVLGHRWTLIGDHHQLPPFGSDDIGNLYQACLNSNRPEIRELVEDSAPFKATLELFGHLFDGGSTNAVGTGTKRPVDQLDVQFRMDDSILQVVRDAFYRDSNLTSDDALCTGKSRHGLPSPSAVADRALVWFDTARMKWKEDGVMHDGTREERHWKNRGEVAAVKAVLDAMGSSLVKKPKKLALLTPYHHQITLLKGQLSRDYRDLVHTVDSFQGQEADIVIVSLVRTNDLPIDNIMGRIGYLASEQRANVLLSRARKLLVIVGDFDHFRNTKGSFWPKVCETVAAQNARVMVRDIQDIR